MITELKTETQQDHLTRLNAEVEALRKQLRRAQRLATVGTMTAMVAHEFNNILTPIINYARLARKNPAMTDKAIASAADGGQRATSICKALLGITREDDDRPVDMNVSELVSQTFEAMARDPRRDRVEVRLDIPSGATVLARRAELQQVLLNLLINARSAVLAKPRPRRIEVSAECAARSVVLRVSDTGVGIAPTNLERIFEPFFTTKSGRDADGDGNGLGLAVCREIVTNMGGEISVESVEGEGTTFTIRLPATPG